MSYSTAATAVLLASGYAALALDVIDLTRGRWSELAFVLTVLAATVAVPFFIWRTFARWRSRRASRGAFALWLAGALFPPVFVGFWTATVFRAGQLLATGHP